MSQVKRGFIGIDNADRIYRLIKQIAQSDPVEAWLDEEKPCHSEREFPSSFSEAACRMLHSVIGSEAIIWAGQPVAKKLAMKAWPVAVFGLLVLSGGLLTELASRHHSVAGFLFPVLIGGIACLIPYWFHGKAAKLFYLIAGNQAVIIYEGGSAMKFRVLKAAELQAASVKDKADGTGDIVFSAGKKRDDAETGGKLKDGDGSFEMSGFYAIEDVKQVYQWMKHAGQ